MLHRIMSYELSMSELILGTIGFLLAILIIASAGEIARILRNFHDSRDCLPRRGDIERRGGNTSFASRARQAINLLLRKGGVRIQRPNGEHARADLPDPGRRFAPEADRDAARPSQDLNRDDSRYDPQDHSKSEHKDSTRK